MGNTLIRDAVIICGLGFGLAMFFANKDKIYAAVGLAPTATRTDGPIAPPVSVVAKPKGTVVSIPKSRQDGQFWTDARVNSGYVRFLVDTGASAVALTLNDAKKAGIRTDDLVYNVPVQTAGGTNYAAMVELKSISIGAITIRNVRALVVPDGLHTSLLGMTYLGQLQKVEATPNALLLRL